MEIIVVKNWVDYFFLLFGFFGFLSFLWIIWYESRTYLRIKIKSYDSTIETAISNRSIFKRKISNSFLVVSKSGDNFLKKLSDLYPEEKICYTNDLKYIYEERHGEGIYLIPLDFYYSENTKIADEDLCFSINTSLLEIQAGHYDVRFYIFPKSNRLHRSTQCIMKI